MNTPSALILAGIAILVISSLVEGYGLSLTAKVAASPWQYLVLGAISLSTIVIVGELMQVRSLYMPLAAFLAAGIFFIIATQIMNTSALWAFGLWLAVAGVTNIIIEKPQAGLQKLLGYSLIFVLLLWLNR